jgi:hypothetical protein
MSGQRSVGRPDGCPRCGQPHPGCAAHNKRGLPCGRLLQTDAIVCLRHGGGAPQVKAATARRKAAAQAELRGYVTPVATDPSSAMTELLHAKMGEVTYLAALVNALGRDELKQRDLSGRYEKPSVWVEMLWHAQDDLRRICKDMFDIGFAERQARYVDGQAMLLAAGLAWFRRQLGLDGDPRAEELERTMLVALASGAPPDADRVTVAP